MFDDLLVTIVEYFKFVYGVFIAIKRDATGIYKMFFLARKLAYYKKNNVLAHEIFSKHAKLSPNKPCIIFNDVTWTFRDVEDYSNKIANFFLKKLRLKKGDCVALFMENQPENPAIWLGLSKIGVITAMINTNLRTQTLLHSINVAKAKYVIYGSSLTDAIKAVENELDKDIGLVVFLENNDEPSQYGNSLILNSSLKTVSEESVVLNEKIDCEDPLMYIYTSGTTGLPKPAVIKHSRYIGAAFVLFDSCDLTLNDKIYVALPIYHGNGCFLGIGSAFISGATVVLKRRFSATNFWKDCIQYDCDAFIYVGEICRFLVNQPASPLDKKHKIRKAIGNGMRENVWKDFYERFKISCCEFYGATEGNCTMVNLTSKIGCCGFVPFINKLVRVFPVCLIKIDDEMNPVRNKDGFCIECKSGEKGLCIGIIGTAANNSYSGYANNSKASNTKVIRDVFKKGQSAFNSGDLMVTDSLGYMYFSDRLGDTYRWRGENVATIEVENTISKHLNSTETVVYGVEIPGEEGKAGMAAVVTNKTIDFKGLSDYLKTHLPVYAKPLFIRLIKEVEHTGTFKTKKNTLIEEGYDVNKTKDDSVYYFDTKDQIYKELTFQIYQNILEKKLRI